MIGVETIEYCPASWMFIDDDKQLVDLHCSLPPGHEQVWPHFDVNTGTEWSE